MILICFGWLACTVRCVTGGKKANSEDHLHKVVQDKQENEFHVFMATWPSDASSLLNYIWYHSKIAFSLSLSLYMQIYRLHIYVFSINLAKYLIKLYKLHRQSAGLTQTSDSISQVKDVRSCAEVFRIGLFIVSKEKNVYQIYQNGSGLKMKLRV